MKHDTGKRSLEGLRVFPYVAWILITGFALFVYNIATELETVTTDLQKQAASLEERMNSVDNQIDFDSHASSRLSPASAE